MSQPISLFPSYDQSENRITNYCLLMLKMIFEESPILFQQVIGEILGEEQQRIKVGVDFKQQVRSDSSVPDGMLTQEPFAIAIETKRGDWFDEDQLRAHMDGLKKENKPNSLLLALGNFDEEDAKIEAMIERISSKKESDAPSCLAVTFDAFLKAIRAVDLPPRLEKAAEELEAFFHGENLLSSWRDWMDVIACGRFPDPVINDKVYLCPDTGGAYSHDRCRYFGFYHNKKVEAVAEIEALVLVEEDNKDTAKIRWKNIPDLKDDALRARAVDAVKTHNWGYPSQAFILGKLHETEFVKDTSGGVRSKQYINIKHLGVKGVEELASKINGIDWSKLAML